MEEYLNPKWENAGRVHDWRNYISNELRTVWGTFTDAQKIALGENAEEIAGREEWD